MVASGGGEKTSAPSSVVLPKLPKPPFGSFGSPYLETFPFFRGGDRGVSLPDLLDAWVDLEALTRPPPCLFFFGFPQRIEGYQNVDRFLGIIPCGELAPLWAIDVFEGKRVGQIAFQDVHGQRPRGDIVSGEHRAIDTASMALKIVSPGARPFRGA
jgi:hypothetical protein